jgi:tetratricopeptide (TPR) repeat protein
MLDKSKLQVAQQYFLDNDYELATEAYQGLISEDSYNPRVIVNKAISEFKDGHYGSALVDLYRAKKIIPRDKKLNSNIELVQEELNLNQPNLSFLNYVTINEVLILLLITNLFFVFRWRLSKSKIMRFFVSSVFVLVLIFATYTYANQEVIDYAVVQSSSLKVFSGNSDSFSEIGELLEGQVVKVKTQNEDWSQINYNDQLGWVKEENLAYF